MCYWVNGHVICIWGICGVQSWAELHTLTQQAEQLSSLRGAVDVPVWSAPGQAPASLLPTAVLAGGVSLVQSGRWAASFLTRGDALRQGEEDVIVFSLTGRLGGEVQGGA